MRKIRVFVTVCAIFLIFLPICRLDGQESETPSVTPINIIVILDTSNRISKEKHPGQAQRDRKIVTEIINLFEIKAKKFIQETENKKYPYTLTFVVPPEYGADPKIPSEITDNLTIGPEEIYPKLKKRKEALLQSIEVLYRIVENRSLAQFPGSDIWYWFKYQAELKKDANNRILCFSDGYLNFDKDIEKDLGKGRYMQVSKLRRDPAWVETIQDEELLETGKNVRDYNVKFMMVEITLKKAESGVLYERDFDILTVYWTTWLKSMGITDSQFTQSNLGIPQLKNQIQSFIFPK